MADETDIGTLRRQYQDATGKYPSPAWDAAELQRRIAETPMDDRVQIVVTTDHVYLPLDEEGHVPADYHADMETTPVTRRTRLKVPADMARSLSARDWAEVL